MSKIMPKLNTYNGKLTVEQIAAGINAATRNSKRLLEDANLLFEAERFPSAAAIAILSIEESGKVAILRTLAVAETDSDVRESWRDYRTHTKKNAHFILLTLAVQDSGTLELEHFRNMSDNDSEYASLLDRLKQVAFYTDYLDEAHWSVPEQNIEATFCKTLLNCAGALVRRETEVTAEEIRLWIKHLGPVWNGSFDAIKKGFFDWHMAAKKSGLITGDTVDMNAFLTTGLKIQAATSPPTTTPTHLFDPTQ